MVSDDEDKMTCDGRVMITREMNFETNDDAESWEWWRWDDYDDANDIMVIDNDKMAWRKWYNGDWQWQDGMTQMI